MEAYAGDFEHPGYGVVSVRLEEDKLEMTYNGYRVILNHYHYNIFETKIEDFDLPLTVSYSIDKKGNISNLSLPFEQSPGAKEIIFSRISDKRQ